VIIKLIAHEKHAKSHTHAAFLVRVAENTLIARTHASRGGMRLSDPFNVLMIVVDDLRPELNEAYSQRHVVTPTLDGFSRTSLTFDRAYVQYSHCSPSRNSFLTGRSPQNTSVYNFIDHFREPQIGANWTTLPQYFKNLGYKTLGGGKIYHPMHPPNDDVPLSWSPGGYFFANGDDGGCLNSSEVIYECVCPSAETNFTKFYDAALTEAAVEQLRLHVASGGGSASASASPFFLGVGLRRPHRSWHVPRRFYDLYPNNGSHPTAIKLAKHKLAPVGTPALAYIDNAWPSMIHMDRSTALPDHIAELGRWGYYAASSFTDYNIGTLLRGLEDLRLDKTTVVALIGDHGWELGEHAEWCKRTNWEVGLRVPLMIRSPRHASSSYGRHTKSLVEALDLYRTLAALAMPAAAAAASAGVGAGADADATEGLNAAVDEEVEGVDLSSLFADPRTSLKDAAFSQMARCPSTGTLGPESACNEVRLAEIGYMGYSIRTDRWRYTVWLAFNGTANRAVWPSTAAVGAGGDGLLGEELYDHEGDDGSDFDAYENVNLATKPSFAGTKAKLLATLRAKFAST
jgi:iduronate 2-sulfatase